MKNKFYTITLALSLGIISPLSYSMEKKNSSNNNLDLSSWLGNCLSLLSKENFEIKNGLSEFEMFNQDFGFGKNNNNDDNKNISSINISNNISSINSKENLEVENNLSEFEMFNQDFGFGKNNIKNSDFEAAPILEQSKANDFINNKLNNEQKNLSENSKIIKYVNTSYIKHFDFNNQLDYLKGLPSDIKNIEYIETNYPYLYKELKKFDSKTNVSTFKDCLGRVYKNIPVAAVVSRFENVGFGASLSYSSTEKDQIKDMLAQLTKIYTKSLNIFKERLNDEENLEEKTKLIHFIEDIIITPIYGNNPSISEYFQGYNRVLAILNFLYFKKDSNNLDEYRWTIRSAWKGYLLGKDCNSFKKIFNQSSENLKLELKKYLSESSKLRAENLSKKVK